MSTSQPLDAGRSLGHAREHELTSALTEIARALWQVPAPEPIAWGAELLPGQVADELTRLRLEVQKWRGRAFANAGMPATLVGALDALVNATTADVSQDSSTDDFFAWVMHYVLPVVRAHEALRERGDAP